MSDSGILPYPSPQDRVDLVVYSTSTGDIVQVVRCALEDLHRQHDAFEGCDYLDVTGQKISPRDSMVDLKSLTIVPRIVPTAAERSLKMQELSRAAAIHIDPPDLMDSLLGAVAGDPDAQAKVAGIVADRQKARAALAEMTAAAETAQTKDELTAIDWKRAQGQGEVLPADAVRSIL